MSTWRGQSILMDMVEHPEGQLLASAARAMEPLGLQLRILKPQARAGNGRPDATVGVRFGGRQLRYAAGVKRGLRPATLGPVVHQLRAWPGPSLLVADYIT